MAQKRKILKRLADAAEVAAEAERLRIEQESAEDGPPSPGDVDFHITAVALGLHHAPVIEGWIHAAIIALGDYEGPDAPELFLQDVAARAPRYGVATTAKNLLAIRAGRYSRSCMGAPLAAYAMHCEAIGLPACPANPQVAPQPEARDLLESWIAGAMGA